MFMRNIAGLMIATAAFNATAEPPRNDIVEANSLLERGKTEAALKAYRNLQVDDPESELLYYNIGCAQLESTPEDSDTAIQFLNAAKTSFDKAIMAEDPTIRRDARYNRINCDSQLAKHQIAVGDFEGTKGAFEDAIYGYEDFLDQYPDHPGARKNLNHMRYELKKLLQNPPPEQEQQEQEQQKNGEGEANQDGEQQEQQNEDGGQQDGEQQDQAGEQKSQGESGEPQSSGDPGTEEGQGEDQQQQPGEEQSEDGQSGPDSKAGDEQKQSGDSQSAGNADKGEESVELPNKDTIEAILDALQERDKKEQQNMRRVPQNPRRSGPWW